MSRPQLTTETEKPCAPVVAAVQSVYDHEPCRLKSGCDLLAQGYPPCGRVCWARIVER
jgi:hypothetical protein